MRAEGHNRGPRLTKSSRGRTDLGRALMGRPKLLLPDGSSMGLSPMVAKQIFGQSGCSPSQGIVYPAPAVEARIGMS